MRFLLFAILLAIVGTGCGRIHKVRVRPHKVPVVSMEIREALALLQRANRHVVYDASRGQRGGSADPPMWFAEDSSFGRVPFWRVAPGEGGYGLFAMYAGEWHPLKQQGAEFVAAVPSAESDATSAALYAPSSPVLMAWGTEVLYARVFAEYAYNQSGFLSVPSWQARFYRFDFADFAPEESLGEMRMAVACEPQDRRRHAACAVYALPWRDGTLDTARNGLVMNIDRRQRPARIQFVLGP
ncbi:MAG: hypothetical protein JRJ84_12170 [Deltaproteobacteria bacterium]|nr:hypothetical protein [Deltaproteobacteria bacterium]